MTKRKRPRMADIAREVNVNRITVSRALSRPELVAADTLRRINEAIATTGYIPNQIARGMKAEHSRIVSLVTPPHMAGVYGIILEDLSQELFKSGLIVNLFPVHEVEGHQEAVLRELAGWRPAAIVTFGFQLTENSVRTLRNSSVPLIELLTYSETAPGSCVGYDQCAAARLLTEHLLDRGYRKVCFVHSARAASAVNIERLKGFADAVHARGGKLRLRGAADAVAADDAASAAWPAGEVSGTELKAQPTFHDGFDLMRTLWGWRVRPEAVLFASDMVAVGALQYCVSHGIKLRDDISLCAFDGIELTSVIQPPLTCLDFPYERVIAEGAGEILARVLDRSRADARIRIPVKVLHRDST